MLLNIVSIYGKYQIMSDKLFKCSNLIPNSDDGYQVSGEETWVIDQATDHVVEEHGWFDSPQVRKDIQKSLVNADPSA